MDSVFETKISNSHFTILMLEDLGIGYCHTHGMGYIGNNVTAKEILGVFHNDENGTTAQIFWSKLVTRPECVDVLTILSSKTKYFRK